MITDTFEGHGSIYLHTAMKLFKPLRPPTQIHAAHQKNGIGPHEKLIGRLLVVPEEEKKKRL